MMKLISSFDRYKIFYNRGVFDDWCVYIKESHRTFAPTDETYFSRLQSLSGKHTAEQLYADFVKIYDITSHEINQEAIHLIAKISLKYGSDATEIRKWFTVIYAGMVAEENKTNK